MNWKAYILLLRPGHYIKNLVIYLPAFFAFRILEPGVFLKTTLAIIGFCAFASAIYILNDYKDRENDRRHPHKKHRPIASGTVPVRHGFLIMTVLFLGGASLFWTLGVNTLLWGMAYVILNVVYTFWLKSISLIDISLIATGFLIRIQLGAVVVEPNIPLSAWIVIMIFLGALFLGLAKRRDDVILAEQGNLVRQSLKGYTLSFLNGAMLVMASVMIVAYLSYTLNPGIQQRFGHDQLYITSFFVIMGLLRYLQMLFVEDKFGNPTAVFLKDAFLQAMIAGWVATFIWMIYL